MSDFGLNAVITQKSLPIIAICECGFCILDTYPLTFRLIAVAFSFSLTMRKKSYQTVETLVSANMMQTGESGSKLRGAVPPSTTLYLLRSKTQKTKGSQSPVLTFKKGKKNPKVRTRCGGKAAKFESVCQWIWQPSK